MATALKEAFFAQMIASLTGIPALLGNPHFKMTDFLKQRIGELMEQRGQSRARSGYAEWREKKTEGQHEYKGMVNNSCCHGRSTALEQL